MLEARAIYKYDTNKKKKKKILHRRTHNHTVWSEVGLLSDRAKTCSTKINYHPHTFQNLHDQLSVEYVGKTCRSLSHYLHLTLTQTKRVVFHRQGFKSLCKFWLLGLWFGYLLYNLWGGDFNKEKKIFLKFFGFLFRE